MTSNYQWEDVDVPRGAFISWGNTPGQHVTGKVLSYAQQGGTDFNGNPCPQIAVELIEPAASINKEGVRTDFDKGELVVLNAGQVSLQRALLAASPSVGDLVKIVLSNLARTQNGTVKEFEIKIARGAGQTQKQPQQPVAASGAFEPTGQGTAVRKVQQSQPPF